jgi:uncharacterized repeat protein (TIGR01451 family)
MNQTNNSIAIMKSPRLSVRNSRAVTLFMSVLTGIVLQSGTATAQTTADLAIAAYNTPLDVYVNDYMPYTMFVTNLGPGTVSSVVVSNPLPSGFSLVDASPTYTLTNNTLIFNLGSLTNLAVQKLVVRAKPASAGSYTFSTSVSAANNTDPNSANNSTSFSVNVGNYLSGSFTMSLISTQWINFDDGTIDQWVQMSNNGSSPVASARINVSGLTTNYLFNAAGTNNGNPFIIYSSTLNPGQSGNMLLEFFPRRVFAFSASQMQAYATPLANLSPPANLGAPIAPVLAVRLTGQLTNSVLIEWPTVLGQSYTILYSDNSDFANPLFAPPAIVAPANETEWTDYGPPLTISQPTNSIRYYRVYLNP